MESEPPAPLVFSTRSYIVHPTCWDSFLACLFCGCFLMEMLPSFSVSGTVGGIFCPWDRHSPCLLAFFFFFFFSSFSNFSFGWRNPPRGRRVFLSQACQACSQPLTALIISMRTKRWGAMNGVIFTWEKKLIYHLWKAQARVWKHCLMGTDGSAWLAKHWQMHWPRGNVWAHFPYKH